MTDDLPEGPIDLQALLAEARRQWWIDSGAQERFERDLYEALTPPPQHGGKL